MPFIEQIGTLSELDSGPRYLRLQKLLREAVDAQRLPVGSALPSERDLCEGYGLSRVTIRKAVDGLVEEGLLERRHGAGTFVAGGRTAPPSQTRVEKSFSALSSFSEDMLARGRAPGNRWIHRSEGAVTPEEALALGLSPGSRVYRFQRIRYADGVAMALEYATICGWALPALGAVENSLYVALEAAGNRPVRALQRVRAVGFNQEQADLLDVAPGAPGLFIERRAFVADGRPLEVTYTYYRGDTYDLIAELGS
jgi:GntR family transcriptional regulator